LNPFLFQDGDGRMHTKSFYTLRPSFSMNA
jgi:hypothetical protein